MTFDNREFIERHLHVSNFKHQLTYSPKELHELCRRSIEVFSKEPSLAKMNPPCLIVGDIHGQFVDLLRLFATQAKDSSTNGCMSNKFIFLGNYVDIGRNSLETICLLLGLKICHPTKNMLLRGNHECAEMNRKEGFFDELVKRFGAEDGGKLFSHFNEVFSWMPLAGVLGGQIFCVHGGLSPHLKSLKDVEKISRPLADISSSPLVNDLLWSDPGMEISGFRPNGHRGRSVFFGEDEVAKFCKATNIKLIIRGHQVMHTGFGLFAERKLISIFGAPRFKDGNSSASLGIEESGDIGMFVLRPIGNEDKIGK